MNTRRWIGIALMFSGFALGIGLQAYNGSVYASESSSWGGIGFVHVSVCNIYPNWPVAVPLGVLVVAGLALALMGGSRNTETREKRV